jgi:hypothetical protein
VLLDVREPHEYEIVHIDGAKLIPLSELPLRVNELDTADTIVARGQGASAGASAGQRSIVDTAEVTARDEAPTVPSTPGRSTIEGPLPGGVRREAEDRVESAIDERPSFLMVLAALVSAGLLVGLGFAWLTTAPTAPSSATTPGVRLEPSDRPTPPKVPIEPVDPPSTSPTMPAPTAEGSVRTVGPPTIPTPSAAGSDGTVGPALGRPIAASARIDINSTPWAKVVIDGVARGQTPLSGVSLAPGRHAFVLRNPLSRQEVTFTIRLKAGEYRVLPIDLDRPEDLPR